MTKSRVFSAIFGQSTFTSALVALIHILFTFGICSSTAYGALVTLTPDEVLEIQFDVPTLPGSDNDFFFIFANGSTITGGFTVVTELYDGNTLLGTYTAGANQITSRWVTAGSTITNVSPEIIDFTTILNGTINGLTRTTISANSITFDTNAVQGQFGEGISSSSFFLDPVEVNILSVNVVSAVPVPPALWLFSSGLLSLIGLSRRKNNQHNRF